MNVNGSPGSSSSTNELNIPTQPTPDELESRIPQSNSTPAPIPSPTTEVLASEQLHVASSLHTLTLCSSEKSTYGSIGEGQSDSTHFFRQDVEVSLHAVQGASFEPTIPTVPLIPGTSKLLSIVYYNARSLVPKFDELVHQLRHTSQTLLRPGTLNKDISNEELDIPGFMLHR